MTTFSRRQVLGAAALGASLAACARPVTSPLSTRAAPDAPEETRTLDQLYADAVAEGGHLVVYAGGAIATEQGATRQAFLTRFPRMSLTTVVDYSKFHDVRVDTQIATGSLVPDVVQLNTLHDFPSWKEEGLLLPYKPAGFSAVHDAFKDADGTWLAIAVIALSFAYDGASVGAAAEAVRRDPGRVDVLVNNAAAYVDWGETAMGADLAAAQAVFDVHLFLAWRTTVALRRPCARARTRAW